MIRNGTSRLITRYDHEESEMNEPVHAAAPTKPSKENSTDSARRGPIQRGAITKYVTPTTGLPTTYSNTRHGITSSYNLQPDNNTYKLSSFVWQFLIRQHAYLLNSEGIQDTKAAPKTHLSCGICIFESNARSAEGKTKKEVKQELLGTSLSITNFRTHIYKNHQHYLTAEQLSNGPDMDQTKLKGTYSELKMKSENMTDSHIKSLITNFVVQDRQPFTAVQDLGFRTLINSLRPDYKIPSATTIYREVIKLHADLYAGLKQKLKELPHKVSGTLDSWTCNYGASCLLGITIHYINRNTLEMTSTTMELVDISTMSHSGDALGTALFNALKEIGIEKFRSFTADNAGNNKTAIKKFKALANLEGANFNVNDGLISCFAHVINLAVRDALSTVYSFNDEDDEAAIRDQPLTRLRRFIIRARTSAQRQHRLATACERLDPPIKPKALVQDVKTRWNSTYASLDRALYLRDAIDMIMIEESVTYGEPFTDDDWNTVKAFVKFLRPFEEVTKYMSGEAYPTLSATVPYFNTLLDFIDKTIANVEDSNNPEAALECNNKIIKYYNRDLKYGCIATCLDPRFNTAYFRNKLSWTDDYMKSQFLNEMRKIWRNEFKQNSNDSDTSVAPAQKRARINSSEARSVFEDLFFDSTEAALRDEDELERYLKLEKQKFAYSPIKWWYQHKDDFPCLYNMALDFLGIPGTSVPSERLFSVAGDVMSAKRNCLKPATARALICCESWTKPNGIYPFKPLVPLGVNAKKEEEELGSDVD